MSTRPNGSRKANGTSVRPMVSNHGTGLQDGPNAGATAEMAPVPPPTTHGAVLTSCGQRSGHPNGDFFLRRFATRAAEAFRHPSHLLVSR